MKTDKSLYMELYIENHIEKSDSVTLHGGIVFKLSKLGIPCRDKKVEA